MPSRAKAVVSVGCTALTLTAVALASPASAAGSATYNCGPWPSVPIGFARGSNKLAISQHTIQAGIFPPGVTVTVILDGVPGPTTTLWGHSSPVGVFPTLNTAPLTVEYSTASFGSVMCTLSWGATGFPV